MSDVALPAHIEREIDLDCVRTLYRQIPNSFAAALVVTIYMMVTLWALIDHRWLWAWLGVQGLAQVVRVTVYLAYQRADRQGQVHTGSATTWGRRYVGYMAVAGVVWALAGAAFIHPGEPLSIAFTLCGLYGITGGSVPGNAYVKSAVMWFIWPVFITVLIRLAWTARVDFTALGLASAAFAGILTLFCRVQHASIRDALRVRFENRVLLDQLAEQKAEADEARHRAERANLAKSQFLAAASHDLRQPLHALGLFSASLQGLRLDDQARSAVHSIQTNIDALEDLFDALLDVSRLDAGVVVAQVKAVALRPLLHSVAQGLQPLAQAKSLRLRVLGPDAWVQADPTLLRRIVGNLAANALRYTEHGSVVLALRPATLFGQPAWRIECRDSGVGIPLIDQERIFDEFVQLHNPQRDRRHGMGLGLAIAQRCARLLGSNVVVRSQPGQGSVFSVMLPASPPVVASGDPVAPQALAATPAHTDDDPLLGRRIMLIDDEASIREGLTLLLSQWGCHVVSVADQDAAMAAFDERIDLVLSDLRLPHGHSGLDAIVALRARRPGHLPICLITGESDVQVLRAVRESGIPLLHKPVRPAQLRATLLHMLSDRPPN